MKRNKTSQPSLKDTSAQGLLLRDISEVLHSCISVLSKKEGLVENALKKDLLYQKFIERDLSEVQKDSLLHDLISHFLKLDAILLKSSLNKLLLGLSNPNLKLSTDHSQDLLEVEALVVRFLQNPYEGLSRLSHQPLLDIVAKSEQALKKCLSLLRCHSFFADKICAPLLAFFGKKEPTVKILYSMCMDFTENEKTWNGQELQNYEKQFLTLCSAFLFKHHNLEKFYTELCLYHQEHKPPEQLSSFSSRNKAAKIVHYHALSEFVQHIEQSYCSHLSKLHSMDASNHSFFAFKCSLEAEVDESSPQIEKIRKLFEKVDKERRLISPTQLTTAEDITLLKKFYRLQLKLCQAKHEATFAPSKNGTSSAVAPEFL